MNATIAACSRLGAPLAALSLLFSSGCISVPKSMLKNDLVYEPTRAPATIDASVTVEATHAVAPEVRTVWKNWMNTDESIARWQEAVAEVAVEDITKSGLFARVLTAPTAPPDYRIKIDTLESRTSSGGFTLRLTLKLLDGRTGAEQTAFTQTDSIGEGVTTYNMKGGLQRLLEQAKGQVIAEFAQKARRQQERITQAEIEALKNAPLADLLASSDRNVAMARERNRALVAAKTEQLPGILRDRKTEELTALVVKTEQTILDLDHESEVAKDRAQQAAAANGDAAPIDELRGLAISYRERIELLKPLLAALKDEIANRNR